MGRNLFIGIGFAIGALTLSGCVPPPAPPPVVVEAPPLVALAPPPPVVLIPGPRPPRLRRHVVRAVHPVIRHRVVRRSVVRTTHVRRWIPGCGSVVHPCNVEHVTAPIQ